MFCPECGTDHHAGEREAETAMDREVEMERLRTKRDVEVARINAGAIKDVAETETEAAVDVAVVEAEAGVEAAEAVADVLTEQAAPEPVPEPVVIVDAPAAEAGPDIEAPPPAGDKPGHEKPDSGYGSSAWYG